MFCFLIVAKQSHNLGRKKKKHMPKIDQIKHQLHLPFVWPPNKMFDLLMSFILECVISHQHKRGFSSNKRNNNFEFKIMKLDKNKVR